MAEAFKNLVSLRNDGKLTCKVDTGPGTGLTGIENIPDGVDYLYSKKSIGKIVVTLW